MQVLHGIAVSPGIAIGDALVIDPQGFQIPRRYVARDAVEQELERLQGAVEAVAGEIDENRQRISQELGERYAAIFSAHAQMLKDQRLQDEIQNLVQQHHLSPELAVSRTLRRYAKMFQQMESSYMAERAHDFLDLEKSLLAQLLGRCRLELSQLSSPAIVLAHDLTPSETARLDREHVLAFATEIGGLGGHTAIVAEGLEIPAVVGLGRYLMDVAGGDRVIVDGNRGLLVLEPDESTEQRYRQQLEAQRTRSQHLAEIHTLPAETLDGHRIHLGANIEFPHEVEACLTRGADGVGLYRTEFLYLGMQGEPSEEDHFQAYSRVVEAMGQRPVVLRTLDLGADKLGQLPRQEEEPNPFLGLRSIRLSLRNPDVFKTQLRAVLRASVLGAIQVMFPLISTLEELRRAKMMLTDTMEDLEEQGIPFRREVPVGMMVEVPAAVVMLDRFLPEVDFISLGTNDLIQYALAVDRSNRSVASLYQAGDPAVLRLIETTIAQAKQARVPVNVCGQMGSQPAYALLLLGLGAESLSVPPIAIPAIKSLCRSVRLTDCREIAQRALRMDSAQEVDRLLRMSLKEINPELVCELP